MRLPFLLVLVATVLPSGVHADWVQYLGPSRSAVSLETGLVKNWPAGGPKECWAIDLGAGFGGAAVQGDDVFVHDRDDDGSERLLCLSLASGETKWAYQYAGSPGKSSYRGARSVPLIDSDRIYVCGPFGDLVCVNTSSRTKQWHVNFWSDFGGGEKKPMWALAQNPLLVDDKIVLSCQTKTTGTVALNKMTGEVVWKTPPLPGRTGYVSPKAVSVEDERHVVVISAGPPRPELFRKGGQKKANPTPPPADVVLGEIRGLDPETGKTLWSYDGWQCQTPIANVTELGEGQFFISGGYGSGAVIFRVVRNGGVFRTEEVLKTQDFGTHIHPPILIQGYLYAECSDNTGRKDGMGCIAVDGTVKWKTGRDPAFDKGAMIYADGMLIALDGMKGILRLIDPSPSGYKELAQAKVLSTQRCWAPMALSEGRLLVRDQMQLKCLDLRADAQISAGDGPDAGGAD